MIRNVPTSQCSASHKEAEVAADEKVTSKYVVKDVDMKKLVSLRSLLKAEVKEFVLTFWDFFPNLLNSLLGRSPQVHLWSTADQGEPGQVRQVQH